MLDANGSYEFALYGSDNDTKPVFELTIPQSLMGQKITLGSDDAQDVPPWVPDRWRRRHGEL